MKLFVKYLRILASLLVIALTACGDRDHGMRVSANVLQILLSRIVLTGEEQGWLSISKQPIIDCDSEFKPRQCLPVKLVDVTKSGAMHVATYRMVVGKRCGTIEQRLLALRSNPQRLSELYDRSTKDVPYQKDYTSEGTQRVLVWEENEQFNPDNEKKFVMRHYVGLIKNVRVDCDRGTIVLHLSADR